MKALLKTIGIIAMAAIIGFTMTGCPPDDGDDGRGGGLIPLTENQWKEGEINSADGSIEYTFSVVLSKLYYIWWNDSGQGDGTKTLDVTVSVKYSDGSALFPEINEVDNGWNSYRSFVSTKDGKVNIKVTPKNSEDTGTFAIVYSTGSNRPGLVPFVVPDTHTPLTEAVWADGTITEDGTDWYSFEVVSGTQYRLWWNEAGLYGDGSKTMNVSVSAWYANGTIIFQNVDDAWGTPRSFTPNSVTAGTVYIKVVPSANSAGTYGIVYSKSATRPLALPPSVTALTADQWEDGELASTSERAWYSIEVTNQTTYYLWWNERGVNGNGTKTAEVNVTAYYANGTQCLYNSDSWNTVRSFRASSDGIVYIQVATGYTSSYNPPIGTFAIVYSTTNTRPAAPIEVTPTPTPLTENVWKDDAITTVGDINWHSFTVTGGTEYRLWWNEYYNNLNTKTLDINVSAYYSDGTYIFVDQPSSWINDIPKSFSAMADDTIYVKITASTSNSSPKTGTYGIVYSTDSTMPTAIINIDNTPLTSSVWTDDEMIYESTIGSYNTKWYSFLVTSETDYYIWTNSHSGNSGGPSFYGDGTKTMSIHVSAFYSDGTRCKSGTRDFYLLEGGWYEAYKITATSDNMIYLRVEPYYNSGGTYSITYTTSNTKPNVSSP